MAKLVYALSQGSAQEREAILRMDVFSFYEAIELLEEKIDRLKKQNK